MITLEKTQRRKELAKALYDVGKLVLATLVIGQFIAAAAFRTGVFLFGLTAFVVTFAIATVLNKGVE